MKHLIFTFLTIAYAYSANVQTSSLITNLLDNVNSSDVTYYLYTLSNPNTPNVITNNDVDQLSDTHFDADKDLFFITHGWSSNVTTEEFASVRRNILAMGYDINVFEVEWKEVAAQTYVRARADVGPIGRLIANFIGRVQTAYGVNSSQILLVGHSLGAHVVGVAAGGLAVRPHSVVGLDPAQPLFTLVSDDRLRDDQADYVEVIHTNVGVKGWIGNLGKSDFYPNGGVMQPGCDALDSTCLHHRAFLFYAESIITSNIFLATKCSSYFLYETGVCNTGNDTVRMGMLYVDESASGSYYLKTSANPPFALN